MKRFPVQYTLQSPVEAALRLRDNLGGDLRQIERLTVEVFADACRRTADPAKFAPANRETADHSLPCCVAMALADGELTSTQFKSGRWQAPDVKALMAMMTCVPSADLEARFPNGRPARLTAQMKDGTQQSILVEAPLGDSSRPMSERQLLDKFLAQTTAVIGADRAMQAAETILNLEKLDNIGSLTALLIAPR